MLGLEGLVAWVLNNYLGKYVENLNTDQLSIALLQGEVELENLPLKKDALRQLGLPIQVRAGFVGKVKLQIPVRKIRSAPWVILIEQLYLVAGPVRLSEYDEEAEEQAAQEDKMARLDALEARWRASQEAGGAPGSTSHGGASSYYSSSYLSWLSYGTSLMTNIVENLQLKIRDVHLRYEDEVTLNPGEAPFALGVTVESLTAQSCDSDGNPHYTASWETSSGASFKLVELQSLALYWDTHASLLGDLSLGELAVAMHKVLGGSGGKNQNESTFSHDYILSPVSGRALVRRDLSERPLRSRSQPRYICDLQLAEVPLTLSDSQYSQMVSCLHGLQSIDKSRHYRKWRPLVGILGGGAREWWNYIARCHSEEARRRRGSCPNWPSLLGRARDLVAYVKAYEAHLLTPSSIPLPSKLLRDRMELELGLEELCALREVAMARVAQEFHETASNGDLSSQHSADGSEPGTTQTRGTRKARQGILLHWLSAWWRWRTTDCQNLNAVSSDLTVGSDSEERYAFEDEILDVLSDTIENDTHFRRDAVFGQLNFTLNQGTFKLFSKVKPARKSLTSMDERTLLMELEFASVKLGFEWRPRSSSHRFYIALGAMYLRDAMTPDSAFSTLVSPHLSNTLQPSSTAQYFSSVQGTARMQQLGKSFAERLGSFLGQTATTPASTTTTTKSSEECLFQLVFEKRPFGTKADYRLHVQSQSLDVVYNASAFRCIIEFFTQPYVEEDINTTLAEDEAFNKRRSSGGGMTNADSGVDGGFRMERSLMASTTSIASNASIAAVVGQQIRTAARHRYEAVKQKTKEEIRRNWEQILGGEQADRKKWEIVLNISAPQIIFVEHFCDRNAVIVVVDFGRLHFSNVQSERSWSSGLSTDSKLSVERPTGWAHKGAAEERDREFAERSIANIEEEEEDDEDEDFQTPCSSPPGEDLYTKGTGSNLPPIEETNLQELTENALHQRMYDRFNIDFGDMQILVGRVKDNWKYARLKGTSALHVLDRFNISLQLERRVVATNDPQWPSVTLSGSLPKLVVHVNEQKVDALRAIATVIGGEGLPSPFRPQSSGIRTDTEELGASGSRRADEGGGNSESTPLISDRHNMSEESRLLLVQFGVEQMSLEVQSRGRSVAELQVSGVQASFCQRPYDTSITLSVHSLLLVDALQTFGPDFELLVASHKHVGMDSVSGSLRDSEPTSPSSPGSPDPHHGFKGSGMSLGCTSPIALSQALHSLSSLPQISTLPQSTYKRALSKANLPSSGSYTPSLPGWPPLLAPSHYASNFSIAEDSEALITVELILVSHLCPSNEGSREALQIASIQFNNLDIIANQETIVELLGFTKRVFPKLKPQVKRPQATGVSYENLEKKRDYQDNVTAGNLPFSSSVYPQMGTSSIGSAILGPVTTRTELTFDFHRLNVLLLRAVLRDNTVIGRKIATATMTGAKIQATLGSDLLVHGSLGGLQVLDLTPEGARHQRILSVGHDPLAEQKLNPTQQPCQAQLHESLLASLSAGMYTMGSHKSGKQTTSTETPHVEDVKAFSFEVRRLLESDADVAEIKLRMASVWYTHSSLFLTELHSCASEFEQYLANLARSISTAAAEMAIGLVHSRADSLAHSLYSNTRLGSSMMAFPEISPRRSSMSASSLIGLPHYRSIPLRQASFSQSMEILDTSGADTPGNHPWSSRGSATPHTPHTPHSPLGEDDNSGICANIKLDILLETPVMVLPRTPSSPDVLVAHLGKITVRNTNAPFDTIFEETEGNVESMENPLGGIKKNDKRDEDGLWGGRKEYYFIEVRDMNLYSLNIEKRWSAKDQTATSNFVFYPTSESGLRRAEELYACGNGEGHPILHNTVIQLEVQRQTGCRVMRHHESFPTLLLHHSGSGPRDEGASTAPTEFREAEQQEIVQVQGRVVTPLKVSLSRDQYEQLLDSFDSLTSSLPLEADGNVKSGGIKSDLSNIEEEEDGSSRGEGLSSSWDNRDVNSSRGGILGGTLKMDDVLRAKAVPIHCLEEEKSQRLLILKVYFDLPVFTVELRSNLGEGEQGLVDLSFQDFVVQFDKSHHFETNIQVSLRALLMEDLLQEPDSKHRYVVVSSAPTAGAEGQDTKARSSCTHHPTAAMETAFLSQSCPDFQPIPLHSSYRNPRAYAAHPVFPQGSLPDRFETDAVWGKVLSSNRTRHRQVVASRIAASQKEQIDEEYPRTPPPSPRTTISPKNIFRADNLVHINVLLVDRNAPNFATHYKSIHSSIDVDFNCLDVVINVESWVVVLDFFGIGSYPNPMDQMTSSLNENTHANKETLEGNPPNLSDDKSDLNNIRPPAEINKAVSDVGNSQLDVEVCSLTLTLVHGDREVACANISHISAQSLTGPLGDRSISGKLGSISLCDLTPEGGTLYRERFHTSGQEALDFHIFSYGIPDPDLSREYDARVQLQMSSVLYVHTHRFVTEIFAFFRHFSQLRDIVNSFRLAKFPSNLADKKVSRESRILLDVHAGSPVILLPISSCSTDMLVVDLGKLTISNLFQFSEDEGNSFSRRSSMGGRQTASFENLPGPDGNSVQIEQNEELSSCLMDVISIDLMNMDLYAGERIDSKKKDKKPSVGKISESPASSQCNLHMGSFWVVKNGPPLLTEKCKLQLQVKRNLDTHISRHIPDVSIHGKLSALHGAVDLSQYKLIRGFFSYHFVESDDVPMPMEVTPEMLWESDSNFACIDNEDKSWTFLAISLDLVNVSIKLQHSHGSHVEGRYKECSRQTSLACIDFIKSRLLLEIFSDSSRDIDLVSQEILITDTRYQDEPVNKRSNVFVNILQPIKSASLNSQVQAEVHHRKRKDSSKFTILLNNMRLMAILDWWEEVRDFIVQNAECPIEESKQAVRENQKDFTDALLPAFGTEGKADAKLRKIYQLAETKPSEVEDTSQFPFELNLNVTESEVVFVEDTSLWDTNAVILKSTTVLSYRPLQVERPLWCNLNHCEVFSCVLGGMEDETALSIIDPVTLNMEITRKSICCPTMQSESGQRTSTINLGNSVSGVSSSLGLEKVLEVQIAHLSVRLSYHDVRMFSRMLNSIPKQTLKARSKATDEQTRPANVESQIKKLTVLGFSEDDCALALEKCAGELEEAALWLTQNATPLPAPFFSHHSNFITMGPLSISSEHESSIGGIADESNEDTILSCDHVEIKMGCLNICVIDDCRDADVPLLELSLAQLELHQRLSLPPSLPESYSHSLLCREACGGVASFIFSSDYYNRLLSGWEPFVEPWKCETSWGRSLPSDASRTECLRVELESQKVLNINVTSSLIDLYHTVKENWTEDYYSLSSPKGERYDIAGKVVKSSTMSPPGYRRRSPFVPFAIRNDTGSRLWFSTIITTPESLPETLVGLHPTLLSDSGITWTSVAPGDIVPFSFEGRGKVRHRDTHKLRLHQIGVRVEGWRPVGPVSVDRVGIYFRHSEPDTELDNCLSVARVVFHVTLEGSAQKLVTVRSALLLTNKLNEAIELKMERSSYPSGASKIVKVSPGSTFPVPLIHTTSEIRVRPVSDELPMTYNYCNRPIRWSNAASPGDVVEEIGQCSAADSRREHMYRYCVHVKRENYPDDRIPSSANSPMLAYGPGGSLITRPALGVPGAVGQMGHNFWPWSYPAHTITLISPLVVMNLLPCDLHFKIEDVDVSGHIKPRHSISIHEVDLERVLDISFHLENFPRPGHLTIPSGRSGGFVVKLALHDKEGRCLVLHTAVIVRRGGALKVTVWALYWLVNRTGLPLIFRQEGVPQDAAGQFEEHEVARSLSPLPFSFSDHEASHSVVVRLGKGLHHDGHCLWSQNFHLQSGTQVRRLHVSRRDARSDIVYMIGIDVRTGRGSARVTNIVTLSPRFQLHNKSPFTLQFAQKYFATTFMDPGAEATYLIAVPDSCLPFHWPRLQKDNLLCVRITDISKCLWSGGFRIDLTNSFHINIRDASGKMHFLRVEVSLSAATFVVVFLEAGTGGAVPPPLRIDNLSEVTIHFGQASSLRISEAYRSAAKPKNPVPYAWDEPMHARLITLEAPGGSTATYDVTRLVEGSQLTYENFIYIAFTGTFKKKPSHRVLDISRNSHPDDVGNLSATDFDPLDVESQQLVLDVLEECSPYRYPVGGVSRVVLSRKQPGRRSQLWRMTAEGQLQHEGSVPPRDPKSHSTNSEQKNRRVLVLDIAGTAPQPFQYMQLVICRPEERRRTTQTWRFTEDGRLCCAHDNLCVQAKDGFFGLREGSEAVLGPCRQDGHLKTESGVALEQAVGWQRLRPGSGFLSVRTIADGPTRVLQIRDIKETKDSDGKGRSTLAGQDVSRCGHPSSESECTYEVNVKLHLCGGLGVSIVSPPEELVYAHLKGIMLDARAVWENGKDGNHTKQTLDMSVADIQIDGQLQETQCPVILHATPVSAPINAPAITAPPPDGSVRCVASSSKRPLHTQPPAIRVTVERLPGSHPNMEIFKHLIVSLKNLTLNIEEKLFLKLYSFVMGDKNGNSNSQTKSTQQGVKSVEDEDPSDFESQRMLVEAASVYATRYYFDILRLEPIQVRLSVYTSSKIPNHLLQVKRSLGLTLIKFEDASVELEPFIKRHPFESSQQLIYSIIKHYKEGLKWQAAKILGSVDFLGNPLGFMNDVSEGVSGLIFEGSVGALVKNVTHGISNSAAKVTESLSDGLGRVILDDAHEETRQRIRTTTLGASSGDHIVAGLKGLGFGLLGGVTSIFTQTYEGAASEGIQGFISGLGKGLVGTVTKPVVGVLDLASEAASAVRDSSRSASRAGPGRVRPPRCVTGPGGLLPQYSRKQSRGQEFLYELNGRNFSELFMAYEILCSGDKDLRILITNERVLVFTCGGGVNGSTSSSSHSALVPAVVREFNLSEVHECLVVTKLSKYYLELGVGNIEVMEGPVSGMVIRTITRPRFRCDQEATADWVVQQINYAKGMHKDQQCTLICTEENIYED